MAPKPDEERDRLDQYFEDEFRFRVEIGGIIRQKTMKFFQNGKDLKEDLNFYTLVSIILDK